jgi:hypothetical protein
MKVVFLAILVLSIPICGQNRFSLTDASHRFDVTLDVGPCDPSFASNCGPLNVHFYRKGFPHLFQTIRLPTTQMWDVPPTANIINRYDDQSVINFNDFNFDGHEDVAICDGAEGGYGMPSYRVYLYSPATRRFVYSRAFTRMNYGGLGMFETDAKKKMHYAFFKSSCCWHQTQGFDVWRGKPRKVYELTEDGTAIATKDSVYFEITTSKLIRGKWRTWVKHLR